MLRRAAAPLVLALTYAAVPSVAWADNGCQGAGTITDHGNTDLVNVRRGGTAVFGGDFTSSDQVPDGLLFRLQVVGEPVDMSSTPPVSWRIDGGPWHSAALNPVPATSGDPYWMTGTTPISRPAPGSHRLDVSLTFPVNTTAKHFSIIGYFDIHGPNCSTSAGWVSSNGAWVSDPIAPVPVPTTPAPLATRARSAASSPTATPSPSSSPTLSPETTPAASPSPTPSDTPSPSPSDIPSPGPSASPTRVSAAPTARSIGAGSGLLWGSVALIVGGAAAVGAIAYRRRTTRTESE